MQLVTSKSEDSELLLNDSGNVSITMYGGTASYKLVSSVTHMAAIWVVS
jgi:hypothetical protein